MDGITVISDGDGNRMDKAAEVMKESHHQVKKGSMLDLMSMAGLALPESGYSSKLETSPRLLTTGT